MSVIIINSVKFDVTVETDNNGVVVCEKKRVHLFGSFIAYIVPSSENICYEIDKLTVNGKDFTDSVKSNKIKINCVTEDVEIAVTFKEDTTNYIKASAAVFV